MGENTGRKEFNTGMPLQYLKGVGEVRARLLNKVGISKVIDLMEYFPLTYIQRQINPSLFELIPGQRIALTAMIQWKDIHLTTRNKRQLLLGISDGKALLTCVWFSYPKIYEELFVPGDTIWISGVLGEYNGQLQIVHPEFELLREESDEPGDAASRFWKERLVLPVYGLTANLTQNVIRRAIYHAFKQFASTLEESLPEEIVSKYSFAPRSQALQMMHFTTNPDKIDELRFRFAYEEFFYLQVMWARHNHYHKSVVQGISFENKKDLTTRLYKKLPFKLTGAQKKVIREIFDDMTGERQMSRLLQGDVGSGKTIVVLFAMLLAVENGYQAALMAPTEILADQHYANISALLEGFELQIVLLKGGVSKQKTELKAAIADGRAQIVIGTHALLQDDVEFYRLGFAAVDEQHRFGVEQRATLAAKDQHPDLLYLSATPIPRSLAMTVYGDLEVSILDELPPNRKPVNTLIRSHAKIDLVYQEIRKELHKGRQIYIVCPLIEESDKVDLLDAQRLYEHIATKVFKDSTVALLHGRMKSKDKDSIMLRFKAGEFQILVSTTVIEVGVDVPNASVMVIEHSERFGLSQLHQLRGRVGRGADQAYCYLIEHQPIGKIGRERLTTMAGTTDGFEIAEKDLELRGPGEYFGTEQSGLPRFRFASLIRDQHILKLARADAFDIIREDPELSSEKNTIIKQYFERQYSAKERLIQY